MPDLLYLNRSEVRSLLPDWAQQIAVVERTYVAMARGRVELPPKPGVHPRPDAFIHAMPAYLMDDDVAAIKWVSGYPSNKQLGLPYINGLMIVNDAATGLPRAVMDAAEITAARTAAASGVCAARFAPAGWQRAAIIGCGEQGRYHAEVLRSLNERVDIAVYDPDPAQMAAMPGRVEPCPTAQDAVRGADVVVTAGPITEQARPVVRRDWLGQRGLVLPIDFNANVTAEVVRSAGLFLVDDVDQYRYYQQQGHFAEWPTPQITAGQALIDHREADLVVCCNLGVGALDAAFANAVLGAAEQKTVGTRLSLD